MASKDGGSVMAIKGYDAWKTASPYDDEPEYCFVCHVHDLNKCVCRECPVCSEIGDPKCYDEKYHMTRTKQQLTIAYENQMKAVDDEYSEDEWWCMEDFCCVLLGPDYMSIVDQAETIRIN